MNIPHDRIETDFFGKITTWGAPKGVNEADEKVNIGIENVENGEKKVDIGVEKVDIGIKKVDIADYLKRHGNTQPTIDRAYMLLDKFGYEKVFGRSDVVLSVGGGNSGASKLLKNLFDAGIIEQVTGYGKGKYRFRHGMEE